MRSLFFLPALRTAAMGVLLALPAASLAGPKPSSYWNVDDVRPGMKGVGQTVMKGTKVEEFHAEVLGVMKNTAPGRDMVLCRLSGLGLEKTGVIAGMSGSPIYIDGKLLGAVAYAWPFGKEPIAGVTPFSQMHGFVEAYERRDLAEQKEPKRLGLGRPLEVGGREYRIVAVSDRRDDPAALSAGPDELWMVPLQTPVAASGITPHTLRLFRDKYRTTGLVPVMGGAAPAQIADEEKNVPLQPGGPLAVALITGDFDLSGIGTVTHIEGNRVYGWGHPFMGLGGCEFPLMTGYIHTVYPRQTVSFKMGSPLRTVGVINADVSTCIAGWLERKPDMMPMRITVRRDVESARTFNVQVVRQRSMLASLVFTALTNSVDMEGELPEEMTADMRVKIELEGRPPVIIRDTYSGASFSGGRAPAMLYSQIGNIVNMLAYNSLEPVRIKSIEAETDIRPGRITAEIDSVELDSDAYAPGDTVQATVFLRPFKGGLVRQRIALKLPADLPEGTYTATVSDDLARARADLRDRPDLNYPSDLDQLLEAVTTQTKPKRTHLAIRVPVKAAGVAVGGQALPKLPPSMVQVLGQARRTGAQLVGASLSASRQTDWVVQGSDAVTFTVTANKRVTRER